MSFDNDRGADQAARAHQIAYELAGSRLTRGIVRAILSLVESVEGAGGPAAVRPGPAPGARQVLAKAPVQEALW